MDAKTLKDRIGEARRNGRVPAQLQAAAVQYAAQRQSAGASLKEVGAELAMSVHTLSYWRARHAHAPSTSLARVRIVDPDAARDTVVVHGPGGLRIEGLSLDHVVELIARLR